ncbi:MAG: hypothetical protein KKB20_03290 [Proteobacteria bacterium]|nr:hypothetical protein [Pseudomonadota bacterium]
MDGVSPVWPGISPAHLDLEQKSGYLGSARETERHRLEREKFMIEVTDKANEMLGDYMKQNSLESAIRVYLAEGG